MTDTCFTGSKSQKPLQYRPHRQEHTMQFLSQYGLFLLQTLTLVAAILFTTAGLVAILSKNKTSPGSKLKIKKINVLYEKLETQLLEAIEDKKALKQYKKRLKKAKKNGDRSENSIYIIDFKGDITASGVDALREEITALLTLEKDKIAEVVLRLESPGGVVHGYGLAASQLKRLRDRGIQLTVIVDKVAASGGYMMACIADKLLSAPFAIIGSIGVIAQLPNFHRFLKKHDIDVEQLTAGDYKRTLTVFGENTKKGREKFQDQLEQTHDLFKDFVKKNREVVKIDEIATGEYWYGTTAKTLNLVDDLITSDDYLLNASRTSTLYHIEYRKPKTLKEKLFGRILQKILT